MRRRPLSLWFAVVLTLGAVPAAHAAITCSLVHKEGTVVIDGRGQSIELPSIDNTQCEGARVQQGDVTACTRDGRGRTHCKTFHAGEKITAASLPVSGNHGGPLVEIRKLLGGSPDLVPAVSRGGADSGVTSLMPNGSVVLLDSPFTLDFSAPALRGIESIEVHADHHDGPVVAVLSPQGATRLDLDILQSGQRYSWRIDVGPSGLPRFGVFNLAPATLRRQAHVEEARLRKMLPADKGAQAVMLAEWLQSHGCAWDAARVLQRAGFTLPS